MLQADQRSFSVRQVADDLPNRFRQFPHQSRDGNDLVTLCPSRGSRAILITSISNSPARCSSQIRWRYWQRPRRISASGRRRTDAVASVWVLAVGTLWPFDLGRLIIMRTFLDVILECPFASALRLFATFHCGPAPVAPTYACSPAMLRFSSSSSVWNCN